MNSKSPQIGFISLGCPKALVDSERIMTRLGSEGYQLVSGYEEADLVIVNTCGFIDAAVEESLESIGEALAENGQVIVTGCLGTRKDEILERYPNVLEITGAQAYDGVMQAVHKHLPPAHNPFTDLLPPQGIKLTPRHYAYLKISEGCNHTCTFCIIPSMRGKLVSRQLEDVIQEAQTLADAGVKELLVVSQDTSAYGLDLAEKKGFFELAQALGELGIWVRMHYVYPYPHVDEVIPLMAEGKILPYLDIPFQHASPTILKRMKRPAAAENILQRVQKWRQICPQITLRSTFIVGFPGETEANFELLLAFLEQAQLDRVGCFEYSPVNGAAANELPDPVPDSVKAQRMERLMTLQAAISAQRLAQKIGSQQRVLIDSIDEEGAIARSQADAPEIDGLVYIEAADGLTVGDWVDVLIEESNEHDLWASPCKS